MSPLSPRAEPLVSAVLVKFSPDANQLRAHPTTREPELQDAPWRIDDFSENAIEAAVRLKEAHGGRVVGVTVAACEPPRELLLRALAMGVDEFVVVVDGTLDGRDDRAVANRLVAAIGALGRVDLVLCGDASADECRGTTGPRVAEALGLPCVSAATKLALEGALLVAERTLEQRVDTVEVALPAVVTVGMETNQPRLPTVLQVMGASRKPIATHVHANANTSGNAAIRTVAVRAPPSSRRRVTVQGEGADELAAALVRQLQQIGEVAP
jgi:electron transfer flavoprotein beta subunit